MPPRTPNLRKRKGRNGNVFWQYDRKGKDLPGGRVRSSLGDSYTVAVQEARRLNAVYDGLVVDRKLNPAPEAPAALIVDDLQDRWIRLYAPQHRSKKGVELATQRYKDYVKVILGSKPTTGAGAIDENDLDELRGHLDKVSKSGPKELHLSDRTKRHILSDTRCMLRWGHRRGLVTKFLDFADVMPRKTETRPMALLSDEVGKILAAAPPNVQDWIRLALLTGMRWSEQKRLQWRSVNLEQGEITIEKSKNRRSRTLPLSTEAAKLLKDMRAATSSVLVMEFECEWADWMVKVNRSKSGIPWHWHQLRHTYATRFLNAGGDVAVLSKLLGHRDITTTMIYIDVWHEAIRTESNRVDMTSGIQGATQGVTHEATRAG